MDSLPEIQDSAPIPLSFPAILRNPGLTDRFAHLRTERASALAAKAAPKKSSRDDREGKRWIRRKENARFSDNPHIVLASRLDYVLPQKHIRPTFPKPLPPYLPRNARVPPMNEPIRDPLSANAGRFSLSLRGMRRELRRSGARAEYLVRVVETEISSWLQEGGVVIAPDDGATGALLLPGVLVGDTETIREVSRTPLQLVWSISEDAFARYVVHCCARFHEIVSFSKEVNGQRLTYLLRPNVTRPDYAAPAALDTPPVTDYSSHAETDSDFLSDLSDTDVAEASEPAAGGALSTVPEGGSAPGSPAPVEPLSDDEWSVLGESDIGSGLLESIEALSFVDAESMLHDELPRLRDSPARPRVWGSRQDRSASSPSRSPARRVSRHGGQLRIEPPAPRGTKYKSFYDYLFS
jgi:hypothetical protein